MKVSFSSNAQKDLLEIVHFIKQDKPDAARKWADSLRDSVMKLADFPCMGRIVPEYSDENIRELIKAPYRIVYKIDKDNDYIIIIAVHHSKKRLT